LGFCGKFLRKIVSGKLGENMIRKTLNETKIATHCIQVTHNNSKGIPAPVGTGFFVSPDGWFITAAHVVTEDKTNGYQPVIDSLRLYKEGSRENLMGAMCENIKIEVIDNEFDFALLKVDFETNREKVWLKDKIEFPYLRVSARLLDEGEPVYSFGYPLSGIEDFKVGTFAISSYAICPRTTSAIVSSNLEVTKMVRTSEPPKEYVLDKALNYGNSGGPIVSTETGNVHAFCSRFQPVSIAQEHLGTGVLIYIPSLYGVVMNLSHPKILDYLNNHGIPNI
jgi:serine protease Do